MVPEFEQIRSKRAFLVPLSVAVAAAISACGGGTKTEAPVTTPSVKEAEREDRQEARRRAQERQEREEQQEAKERREGKEQREARERRETKEREATRTAQG